MLTELILDRANKQIIAYTTQDVEPILDRNHVLRGEVQRNDWARHVATIPSVILLGWLNEEYAKGNTRLRMFTSEFYALVAKKLQDSDWKHLRIDR
jgi:hypothetical protein